jgi:hypothetical protein
MSANIYGKSINWESILIYSKPGVLGGKLLHLRRHARRNVNRTILNKTASSDTINTSVKCLASAMREPVKQKRVKKRKKENVVAAVTSMTLKDAV